MGWLEVLAQLKRVLPLLTRLAPMLETFTAARGGTRSVSDTALEQVAGDIKGRLDATAQKHGDVVAMLGEQALQIAALANTASQIRHENDRTSARLLEMETELAALARSLRKAAIVGITLLVLCLGLLFLLLLHSR